MCWRFFILIGNGVSVMHQNTCFREFARYSALSVLGTLGVSCYILADTFFVAKALGANGLAALNLVIPVFNFLHGLGMMLGIGGATKFSICKGQDDLERGVSVYRNIVFLAAVAAVFFVTAGACFPRRLAALLGADAEILEPVTIYLRWLLLFAPAFLMNNILLCFVRNDGAPQLAMAAMLIGNFANIVLDYLFIFPFGLGIFGAILATGLSPVISILALLSHRLSGRSSFRLGRFWLLPELLLQCLSLGFPSLLAQVSAGVVMIIFNSLILQIAGNVGVAAYGVIANIALVVNAVYNGLAQGVQPLLSDRYGKGQQAELRLLLRYSLTASALVSVAAYLFLFMFAALVTAVFNSEQNVLLQSIAPPGIRLYFLYAAFAGYNTILSIFFTSTERVLPAQALSLLRGFVLIVPLAFLLSAWRGMTGIWLVYPIAEALTAAVGMILHRKQCAARRM